MATHLRPVQWEQKTLQSSSLQLFDYSPKCSIVHDQKSSSLSQKLADSRLAFFQNLNSTTATIEEKPQQIDSNNHDQKKASAKKISFKIKKTSSVYRRNPPVQKMTTINANKVAELTMKFDGLNNEKNSVLETPKIRKLLKRVNSQKSLNNDKVTRKPSGVVARKPSVKTKPNFDEKVIVKRKPILKQKSMSAKNIIEEQVVRPTQLSLLQQPPPETKPKVSPTSGSVKATIEIFEKKNFSLPIVPKPKVPEKPTKTTDNPDELEVQIVNILPSLPQRRCDSMYETANLRKVSPNRKQVTKSMEIISNAAIKPNTSFLWSINQDKSPSSSKDDWKSLYDFVDPKPHIPPKGEKVKPPIPPKKPSTEEKIYEELNVNYDEDTVNHSYEYCESDKYEEVGKAKTDDGYEYCEKENIYETLPPPPLLPRRQQSEPLPPRPPSPSSYCTIQNGDASNCYESIYTSESKSTTDDTTYESIYGGQSREGGGSSRNSLGSSDQQSNSLYGRASLVGWSDEGGNTYSGKATSDLSSSDRSDDWIDVTDTEDNENQKGGIVIVRERHKFKKSGWSQQCREQFSKSPKNLDSDNCVDSDADHLYESLSNSKKRDAPSAPDDDYDSFDSDTDTDSSFTKVNSNDSGLDIGNNQLPEPPNNQTYVLTRLAATAGKHMRKLRRNWSLTKNDISKSLSRMTKKKSRTDLDTAGKEQTDRKSSLDILKNEELIPVEAENKTLPRKSFLNKFRRSMSLSQESANEVTTNLDHKPKSTFYLTNDIDIERNDTESERDSGASLSPVQKPSRTIIRPQSPPPPAPIEKAKKRSTSWYAEVGLFKNSENLPKQRPSTFWYAEVGLYQKSRSTPSTSSAENSGNNTTVSIKHEDFINQDNSEEYYNLKNDSEYYNDSINSFSSTETKKDQALPDIQLRLQDEPLYQFYDAAVIESVCNDMTSDFDSDGYEEVGDNSDSISIPESRLSSRPSALELVNPNKTSASFSRTLWCEIPEVINSSVLSTLSSHQKKLQEAKFEMLTSEASYYNSLTVLHQLFIKSLRSSGILTVTEFEMLFGKVEAVKDCSEKLLYDLEMCWQDNILLEGVCDIVQKHAEENFSVYVSYCENQILLDETLRKLKERPSFQERLKQLESSSTCQSLTLYSFLMLPMQRITRWPLLIDAVLKRLVEQDPEYLVCQFTLASLNKIVNQCNEGARRKERENEMHKIVNQLEFSKGMPPVDIFSENRWLIKSGPVTHMQQRTDEIKLTFGKRFIKSSLHMFLFNDILFVTKPKNENLYTVIHYCPRNLVDLNTNDMLNSIPVKDTQGRHLLFLTLLENQNEKTVEMLLSCSSESDKERWIEAFSPPKSEDPDETLYECWDCPQVTAIHNYLGSQPDELALNRGDIINVSRKMLDGWYHGERIRDGQTGWFPANYTTEVANPHVRSRNLKQRYRLLAFSENYLKTK